MMEAVNDGGGERMRCHGSGRRTPKWGAASLERVAVTWRDLQLTAQLETHVATALGGGLRRPGRWGHAVVAWP